MTSKFKTDIVLWRHPTTTNFFVVWEQLTYHSELLATLLTVLPGYRTNGASVPRLLRPVLDPFGSTVLAPAILHDCLYETALLPRSVADAVFLEAMLSTGTNAVLAKSAWSAVRMFGQPCYGSSTAATELARQFLQVTNLAC